MKTTRLIPYLIVAAWGVIILSPLLHQAPGALVPAEAPPEVAVARIRDGTVCGQVFRAERDGLSALGIVAQAVGGPGQATWQAVLASAEGVPLQAASFAPRMRWGKRPIWFTFPPLPDSKGKEYRLWIRKVPGGGLRDILVFGTLEDTDPGGSRTSGWRDRVGDLSLSMRYRTPTPGRLLPLPPPPEAPWFASEPVKVASLLVFALALVLVLSRLARGAFGERGAAVSGAVVAGILLVPALVGGEVPGRFALSPGGAPLPPDDRQYSLTEECFSPGTEILPGGGAIHIREEGEPAIIMMRPNRGPGGDPLVRFHIALPPRPVLSFVAARGEGAELIVAVEEGGIREEVWRSAPTPEDRQARRRMEVDLSRWEGRTVRLILQAAGPVSWDDPRIASRADG